LNELEIRYLNGIVEYCHGLGLENEGKGELARSHLESSMDLLMLFRTPVAEELRHALGLRMNCFSGQWGCAERSPFQIAEMFFCAERPERTRPDRRQPPHDPCIWVNPTSLSVLRALWAYHVDDDRTVFTILNSIKLRDRNDEDKVNLIEARTRARMGDLGGALTVYEKFVDHPVFGGEAEQYRSQFAK
jgi:hypothetical protein